MQISDKKQVHLLCTNIFKKGLKFEKKLLQRNLRTLKVSKNFIIIYEKLRFSTFEYPVIIPFQKIYGYNLIKFCLPPLESSQPLLPQFYLCINFVLACLVWQRHFLTFCSTKHDEIGTKNRIIYMRSIPNFLKSSLLGITKEPLDRVSK